MTPQTIASTSMGIGMFSSALAGYGQHEAGQAEEAAYDYNAAITLENMRSTMRASQQKYSELVGRQATAYARAGVDITSGSPLLMMTATAARGGAQAAEISTAGNEQAALQKYYGKLAAWKGTFGGIGTFLKGMSSSAMDYLKINPPTPGNIPTDSAWDT
jgi:hypothetical protein